MANIKNDKKEKKIINTYLEIETLERFEKVCKALDRNKSNMLKNIIVDFLEKNEQEILRNKTIETFLSN